MTNHKMGNLSREEVYRILRILRMRKQRARRVFLISHQKCAVLVGGRPRPPSAAMTSTRMSPAPARHQGAVIDLGHVTLLSSWQYSHGETWGQRPRYSRVLYLTRSHGVRGGGGQLPSRCKCVVKKIERKKRKERKGWRVCGRKK